MKSWTSIVSYLWKNTCKRWLEYPVSPISKLLIPALLGILAIAVLSMFATIERELRDQLASSSAYTVMLDEFVSGDKAPTTLQRTYEEEILWGGAYPAGAVHYVRQPLMQAYWGSSKQIPVFAFREMPQVNGVPVDVTEPPAPLLLTTDSLRYGGLERIELQQAKLMVRVAPVPRWMQKGMSLEAAVAIPVEMAHGYLQRGFMVRMLADLGSMEKVSEFVTRTQAYYKAEQRRVQVHSALEVLENLERLTAMQRVVRSLIVLGCGIILALTLGAVAWLEYRQEVYLMALLRSFGTPPAFLLMHMLMENLIVVFAGLLCAWLVWPAMFELIIPQLQVMGLEAAVRPEVSVADQFAVVAAALTGVFLAMIPVAIGLRKPPGLILQ